MDNTKIHHIIKSEALCKKEQEDNFFFTSNDANWIFDFRKVFMQGKLLQEFASFFWDKYENEYPFQVGGLELGAIPLITGIVMEGVKRGKNINSFFVRKERKTSWLWNVIEGNLDDTQIIVVDDLFNSGATIDKVRMSLLDEEKKIYKIFTFINFWSIEWKEFLEKNELNLDYEFTLSDFWLDGFGNSLDMEQKHYKMPVIFPDFQKLHQWKNANKFLEVPKSNPLKVGKNIYVWSEGWKLSCICSDTGNIVWDFEVGVVSGHKNILSSPLSLENTIIFGSYDGNLYCLDKDTWRTIWSAPYSDWIGSSPSCCQKAWTIVVGLELSGMTHKWSLAGLESASGEKKWEVFFDDFVHCSPWVSQPYGLVLCGGNDGKLVCVRSDNGTIIFERKFEAPIKWWFSFSEDGKHAYFGCFDNHLYCIEVLTGQIVWQYKTDNIVYATPIIKGNDIFFGSLDKYFYHLDSKWELVEKIKTFGKVFSKPVPIMDDLIVFGSNDSYIYFYNYKEKKVVFVIENKQRITTSVIFDDTYKHLYVYDFLNILTKYNLTGFIQ